MMPHRLEFLPRKARTASQKFWDAVCLVLALAWITALVTLPWTFQAVAVWLGGR
jgi:hypothetical protein